MPEEDERRSFPSIVVCQSGHRCCKSASRRVGRGFGMTDGTVIRNALRAEERYARNQHTLVQTRLTTSSSEVQVAPLAPDTSRILTEASRQSGRSAFFGTARRITLLSPLSPPVVLQCPPCIHPTHLDNYHDRPSLPSCPKTRGSSHIGQSGLTKVRRTEAIMNRERACRGTGDDG